MKNTVTRQELLNATAAIHPQASKEMFEQFKASREDLAMNDELTAKQAKNNILDKLDKIWSGDDIYDFYPRTEANKIVQSIFERLGVSYHLAFESN